MKSYTLNYVSIYLLASLFAADFVFMSLPVYDMVICILLTFIITTKSTFPLRNLRNDVIISFTICYSLFVGIAYAQNIAYVSNFAWFILFLIIYSKIKKDGNLLSNFMQQKSLPVFVTLYNIIVIISYVLELPEMIGIQPIHKTAQYFEFSFLLPYWYLMYQSQENRLRIDIAILTLFIAVFLLSSRAALIQYFTLTLAFCFFSRHFLLRFLFSLSITVFIILLFSSKLQTHLIAFINDSLSTIEVATKPADQAHDFDRILHIWAMLEVMSTSTWNSIFGFGFNSQSFLFVGILDNLYATHVPQYDFIKEIGSADNIQTFGIQSFVISFGLAGVLFVILRILSIVHSIIMSNGAVKRAFTVLLSLSIILALLRLFGNSFLSSFFFWFFCVFPGLKIVMACSRFDKQKF